jgi:hypothetical protein
LFCCLLIRQQTTPANQHKACAESNPCTQQTIFMACCLDGFVQEGMKNRAGVREVASETPLAKESERKIRDGAQSILEKLWESDFPNTI